MKIKSCLFIISIITMAFAGCSSRAEREFVNGCKTSGLESSTCKCIYEELEDKYGEEGLKNNLYTLAQTENFQRDMMQSSFQCATRS